MAILNSTQTDTTTRTLGVAQGYKPLHIEDNEAEGFPVMVSHWVPSAEEIRMLDNGGAIRISVLGVNHPPIKVEIIS
jgi:hypothetical protein